ncbi:Prolyl oligopeptidase family protein [compost metagenome]
MNQIPYEKILQNTYKIPMFMIHGMLDEKAPYEQAQIIMDNQTSQQPLSKLWLLPKGHHELIYSVNKREYLQKTLSFLEQVSRTRIPPAKK